MSDLLASTQHLLAGNAIFTVLCPASGERFTYHFYAAKSGKNKGIYIAKLLTGSNNTQDYTRLGVIDPNAGTLELDANIGTGKAGVPTSAALARWLVRLAVQGADTPKGLEIHHAGQCLRCGRLLTVPFPANPYRQLGLGPECGAK